MIVKFAKHFYFNCSSKQLSANS